jgi:hypothetical protein
MISSKRFPYPGLRAFTRDESDLFFGREGCVDAMVDRFASTRFLAVLGPSGSGKSSLVRTGFQDALDLGLHPWAGSRWKIADLHPGGQPMRNLATALLDVKSGSHDETDVQLLTAFLGHGPRSVVEWASGGNLESGWNLLIMVDQFEELFRYGDYAQREEAEAFVALLLESASADGAAIHVVITMRSEYLGACALIPGLAERINSSLYLTPRMSREECREAIEGPASVIGFKVERALVNRLLNDLGSFAPWETGEVAEQAERLSRQADQLPLMQHVLNRLWVRAESESGGAAVELKLSDYERIGGLSGALDAHGAEVMADLGSSRASYIESIFRALISGTSVDLAVRRPCRLAELIEVADDAGVDVVAMVDAFRAPGCNFLRTSEQSLASAEVIVDISHESLIRQWTTLRAWLQKEARASAAWKRIVAAEERYRQGEGGLLAGLDLQSLMSWWESAHPTPAWASRHGGQFTAAEAFVQASRKAESAHVDAERRRQHAERKRLRFGVAGLAAALAIFVGLSVFAFKNARDANSQRNVAIRSKHEADIERDAAKQANENTLREARRTATVLDEVSNLVYSDRYKSLVGISEFQSDLMHKLAAYQTDLTRQQAGVIEPASVARDDYRRAVSFEMIGDAAQAMKNYAQAYEVGRRAVERLPRNQRPPEALEVNFINNGYIYAWFLFDIGESREGSKVLEEMKSLVGGYGAQSDSEALLIAHSRLENLEYRFYWEKNERDLAKRHSLAAISLAGRAAALPNADLEAMALSASHYFDTAEQVQGSERDQDLAAACTLADRMVARIPTDRRSIIARFNCLQKRGEGAISAGKISSAREEFRSAQEVLFGGLRLAPEDQSLLLQMADIENSLAASYRGDGEEKEQLRHRLSAKQYVVRAFKGRALLERTVKLKNIYVDLDLVKFDSPTAELSYYKEIVDALASTLNVFPKAPNFAYVAADASVHVAKILGQDPKNAGEAEGYLSNAIGWFENSGSINDPSTFSEDFDAFCSAYEEKVELRGRTGNVDGMLADTVAMRAACTGILKKFPFDIYIRNTLANDAAFVGKTLYDRQRYREALPYLEYASHWGNAGGSKSLAATIRAGHAGDPDEKRAKALDLLAKKQGEQHFTVSADFSGVSDTSDVFLEEWPADYPYEGIDDQVQWLKEARNGVIRREVVENFRKVFRTARADGISYPQLAASSLDSTGKEKPSSEASVEASRKKFRSEPTPANLEAFRLAANDMFGELSQRDRQRDLDALQKELVQDGENLLSRQSGPESRRVAWDIYIDQGDRDPKTAKVAFERSVALAEALPDENPDDLYKRVVSYERLGDHETQDHKIDAGREWYAKEVEAARKRYLLQISTENLRSLEAATLRLIKTLTELNMRSGVSASLTELAGDADILVRNKRDPEASRLWLDIFNVAENRLEPNDPAVRSRFERCAELVASLPEDNADDLKRRISTYYILAAAASADGNHESARQWMVHSMDAAKKNYTLETTSKNLSLFRLASNFLSDQLAELGRQSEATPLWKSLADAAELLVAHTYSVDSLREGVLVYTGLAGAATREKDSAQAQRYLARAEALVQSLPGNTPDGTYALWQSFEGIGDLLRENGTPAGARAAYAQASESLERYMDFVTAASPKYAADDDSRSLSVFYGSLSWNQLTAGNFAQAVETARRGLEIEPGAAWIEANLAHGLLLTGKQAEAIDHYLKVRKGHDSDGRPMIDAVKEDFEIFRSLGFGNAAMDDILKRMSQ